MAWSKKRLAVYGLSAEGYWAALRFSENGFETSIIDEMLNSPIKMSKKHFSMHKTVDEFFEGENLAEIASLDQTISHSDFLLFCPKIRCDLSEIYHHYERSLKEIVPILSKDSVIIFWVPLGQDGNKELTKIVQKYSALSKDEYGILFLPPFFEERTNIIGTLGKTEEGVNICRTVFNAKIMTATVDDWEKTLFNRVLERFSYYTSKMVSDNKSSTMEGKSPYYNDLFSYLTDLKMIHITTKRGSPLKSFSSSLIRMTENYPKSLLSHVKELTNEHNIKPSKAKIIVVWRRSNYNVRPDIEKTSSEFIKILQDIYVDIQTVSFKELEQKRLFPSLLTRVSFFIACSDEDFKILEDQMKNGGQDIKTIRATLPPSTLK
jgi:hypothetical protein